MGVLIEITLPWPPLTLMPNAKRRAHWSSYSKDAKSYREACWALARKALGRKLFASCPAVEINFYPPDARNRDDDGMIGAFKNGRDGIADAIRWDDKHWRPQYHFHPPHRPDGKVVVVLREAQT